MTAAPPTAPLPESTNVAPATTGATSLTPTEAPVSAPTIESFDVVEIATTVAVCPLGERLYEFAWHSGPGVTGARLGRVGGPAEPVAVSGAVQQCASDGDAYVLSVSNSAGSTTRTVTVP